MRLALKFALLRISKTQRQLAAEVGISEPMISRIVRGSVDPRPHERRRIAKALGLTVPEVFS